MSLNETVSAERIHIGFFGLRNAGKSSLVNAVTGQDLSLVSAIKGTTTDPVKKAMEILPLGPVVITDTPGIDDSGELGSMRAKRAKQMLEKTDIAVLTVDCTQGLQKFDFELIELFRERNIPYLIAMNKCELINTEPHRSGDKLYVSAKNGSGIYELKEALANLIPSSVKEKKLVGDLINPGDIVVLVTPIDESAPKGRMILPQQQMIRDILDNGAVNIVVKDSELEIALTSLKKKPKLVITDSQAFEKVAKIVPDDILLTSFSILFARYKGELDALVRGASALDTLSDDDTVLISESCTHHRQCNDIGSVKLPNWIEKYTGKRLLYEFSSGGDFPENLEKYALIVHCGGCMITEREMKSRIKRAKDTAVPITNYGTVIAYMHGILKRSLSPFPKAANMLQSAVFEKTGKNS